MGKNGEVSNRVGCSEPQGGVGKAVQHMALILGNNFIT
jgi:hypothetical protein